MTSTPTMFSGQRATRNAIADIDLETMARRLLAEAFTSAIPGQWEARARAFESCRPKRGDYFGRATRAQVAAQDQRMAELAAACRLHAALLRGDDLHSFCHLFDVAVYIHGDPAEPLEVAA